MSSDILKNYIVEFHDASAYNAVEQLLSQFGLAAVQKSINKIMGSKPRRASLVVEFKDGQIDNYRFEIFTEQIEEAGDE